MKALADAVAPMTWNGLWPGRVVDDKDPTQDGLVRVRVDQVYGDPDGEDEAILDTALPWARVLTMGGPGTGQEWTPPIGARVLVGFWAGDGERPFVLGGYHPPKAAPDHRIPEHISSYANGPKTRIIRTAGGQVFEMRWKDGEEHVHVRTRGGVDLDLVDAPALGGPKLVATLPSGRTMGIDDKLQRGFIQTPTQSVVVDDAAMEVSVTSPTRIRGTVGPTSVVLLPASATVTAPTVALVGTAAATVVAPQVSVTTTTPAGGTFDGGLFTFAAALTINFIGALILTGIALSATFAVSVLAFVSLNVLSTAINLGVLINVKKLLNENYHALMKAHRHTDSMAGTTSGIVDYAGVGVDPSPLSTLTAAMTTNVQAS